MKIERSEAEGTHMERHRVRTEELVASHDTVKLLKGRSTTSRLDIHGSQWQGRGRDQSQIVQEIPQVQFV